MSWKLSHGLQSEDHSSYLSMIIDCWESSTAMGFLASLYMHLCWTVDMQQTSESAKELSASRLKEHWSTGKVVRTHRGQFWFVRCCRTLDTCHSKAGCISTDAQLAASFFKLTYRKSLLKVTPTEMMFVRKANIFKYDSFQMHQFFTLYHDNITLF